MLCSFHSILSLQFSSLFLTFLFFAMLNLKVTFKPMNYATMCLSHSPSRSLFFQFHELIILAIDTTLAFIKSSSLIYPCKTVNTQLCTTICCIVFVCAVNLQQYFFFFLSSQRFPSLLPFERFKQYFFYEPANIHA